MPMSRVFQNIKESFPQKQDEVIKYFHYLRTFKIGKRKIITNLKKNEKNDLQYSCCTIKQFGN